jgi:tetratricopeptide (TPR) repeat protein
VTRLHQGDLPGTEQSTLAGLRELGGANEPILRAELRRNLAAVYAWRNESHAALNELRSTQHDVERLGSTMQKFEFWESLAIVLDHVDEVDESERTHRRAIDAAVEIGHLPGAAQGALNLAVARHDAGRLREALAALERARSLLAAVSAERVSYSSLNLNYGLVLRGLGEYIGALEQLELAIENCRAQTPCFLPLALAHRAQAHLQLGQFARAQQDLDAAVPSEKSAMLVRVKWLSVRAALQRQLGQRNPRDLEALIAQQPPSGRRISRWRLQRAWLDHVDDADAAEHGRVLLDEVVRAGRVGLAISIGAALAPRLAALGRNDEAHSVARHALERLRDHDPDDAYRGDVWWSCYSVLRPPKSAGRNGRLPAVDVPFELAPAAHWLRETARLRVPAEFRDSFLNRNRSNQELLRAADAAG